MSPWRDVDPPLSVCPVSERQRGAWSLVCDTEEQWVKLAEGIKHRQSSQDRQLYRIITQNFIPEIGSMMEHKVSQTSALLVVLLF